VATRGKCERFENGGNKPKPLPRVATGCAQTLIVRMGSRLASTLPCPAGRSVPGRGGPERRRRPRPDGTGTLNAHAVAHETIRQPARQGSMGWYGETATLLLKHTKVDVRLRDEKAMERLRA
jgi:hypothetical protein